jgi:hypothetical protein
MHPVGFFTGGHVAPADLTAVRDRVAVDCPRSSGHETSAGEGFHSDLRLPRAQVLGHPIGELLILTDQQKRNEPELKLPISSLRLFR